MRKIATRVEGKSPTGREMEGDAEKEREIETALKPTKSAPRIYLNLTLIN